MKFQILILGCSSATPTAERHPSAQLLNINEALYLVDCGEATQIQLRRNKIKIQRINHIFISHLHGDHYLGITGLLSTMSILGRKNSLHIYASPRLKDIIDLQVQISDIHLNFEITWHFLESNKLELLHTDKNTVVYSFPLNHRIPTHGFLFVYEASEKNIDKDILLKELIPHEEIIKIKKGADFLTSDGRVLKNKDLTKPGKIPLSYAYCADTIYDESIVGFIKDVDLLYHEATFMQDMASTAKEKFHSTTIDAANIALKANAKQLIIGHYSARYDNLQPLLEEARTVFGNTLLAEEGKYYDIST